MTDKCPLRLRFTDHLLCPTAKTKYPFAFFSLRNTGRKQLRGFFDALLDNRPMPFRKIGFILSDMVHNIREPPGTERP